MSVHMDRDRGGSGSPVVDIPTSGVRTGRSVRGNSVVQLSAAASLEKHHIETIFDGPERRSVAKSLWHGEASHRHRLYLHGQSFALSRR